MNCPGCGMTLPKSVTNMGAKADIGNMVKKATEPGSKLKSLRGARTRPDAINKGEMTRGGRYARN